MRLKGAHTDMYPWPGLHTFQFSAIGQNIRVRCVLSTSLDLDTNLQAAKAFQHELPRQGPHKKYIKM